MSKASTQDIAEALYTIAQSSSKSDLAGKIAAFVSQERRSKDLPAILRAYEQLRFQRDGVLEARVQSAFPLTDQVRQQVVDMLKQEFQGKVDVLIDEQINPEVLSGIRVTALGKEFDSSAQTKLLKLTAVA